MYQACFVTQLNKYDFQLTDSDHSQSVVAATSNTTALSTHLQTGDGEVGYESNNFRVVFYFDQLPQLIVTLQPREQTTELMVVIRIRQTLQHKTFHNVRRPGGKKQSRTRVKQVCYLPVGLPISS